MQRIPALHSEVIVQFSPGPFNPPASGTQAVVAGFPAMSHHWPVGQSWASRSQGPSARPVAYSLAQVRGIPLLLLDELELTEELEEVGPLAEEEVVVLFPPESVTLFSSEPQAHAPSTNIDEIVLKKASRTFI